MVNIDKLIKRIEEGKKATRNDCKLLLSIIPSKNNDLYEKILELSFQKKYKVFKGVVYPVVPLYVSSICNENCIYCNYRTKNKFKKIERTRLSNNELEKEVKLLVKKGYRVIELVYSSDPIIKIKDICTHVRITHNILNDYGGGKVGINGKSYSIAEYKILRKNGLDFAVLWQETYNKAKYRELHPGNTEKSNYNNRLETPKRMIMAGFNTIGLGVLSGLYDWRKDWYNLISHVDYLLRKYKGKIKTVILGIPRLKPCAGALLKETSFIPNDKEFLLAVAIFNLFSPKALPFVNTRENWDMCIKLSRGGGVLFTFDCKTIPGGYIHLHSGYQFPTFNYSFDCFSDKLKRYGLKRKPLF